MQSSPLAARWHRHPPRAVTPTALRGWLTDARSMTERIRARCSHFSVRVIRQRLDCAYADEAAILPVRAGERVWVREVLLIADGCPVVFGRTLLPGRGRRGVWRLFHNRGTRPLGEDLFDNPRIRRQELRSTCVDRRDARYHYACDAAGLAAMPKGLWARRSVFLLHDCPLMVSEFFLPAIFDLPV